MPGLLTSSCNVRTLLGLEHMSAIGVDLVRGAKTLSLIKEFGLPGKILFAGPMTWLPLSLSLKRCMLLVKVNS